MPRHSPYPVVLSPEERHALTARAAQYTRPYFEVQRAKMILLAAAGWTNDAIADRLQTRREVVSLWRKRFYDDRLAGLDDRPRSGRPRVFSPRGRRRRQSARL
jgi:transposase